MKSPVRIAKVQLGPRNYHGFENVAAVHFFVSFNLLIHENQRFLAAGSNAAPDHNGLRILAMFDNGRRTRRLYGPDPVVLVVVGLLDGEQLLICEKDALLSPTCGPWPTILNHVWACASQLEEAISDPFENLTTSDPLYPY